MFDFLKKKVEPEEIIVAPINGKIIESKDIPDATFSEELLGKSIAIEPAEGKIFSPVDGLLSLVADTKHAISITSNKGCEILIHIGIDTVKLNGEPFKIIINQGEAVKKGDLLLEFDMEMIKDAGLSLISPVIILNTDEYKEIKCHTQGNVGLGDVIIEVFK